MKRNAIVRIILYSLVALLLIALLVVGILEDGFHFSWSIGSGTVVENEASVDAGQVKKIQINWVAGNVEIQTGDVEQITFRETASGSIEDPMVYNFKNGVLELNYSKGAIRCGIDATVQKDLLVIVPQGGNGRELGIDGAGLDITVEGLTIQEMEIDGADANLNFTGNLGELSINGADTSLDFSGSLKELSIDGASCQAKLDCTTAPDSISMDGMDCDLDITLPGNAGFQATLDGLDCELRCSESGNAHFYGNGHCKIDVSGMACHVEILYK